MKWVPRQRRNLINFLNSHQLRKVTVSEDTEILHCVWKGTGEREDLGMASNLQGKRNSNMTKRKAAEFPLLILHLVTT